MNKNYLWPLAGLVFFVIFLAARKFYFNAAEQEEAVAFSLTPEHRIPGDPSADYEIDNTAPVSIQGRDMRYQDSEKIKSEEIPSTRTRAAQMTQMIRQAKPAIAGFMALSLDDMDIRTSPGSFSSSQGADSLQQARAGKDLTDYHPETEEGLAVQAARRASSKKRPAKLSSVLRGKPQSRNSGQSALDQLRAAARMGNLALASSDPESQLLLSRAFVTGENPAPALDKLKGSHPQPANGGFLRAIASGILNLGGAFGWSSLFDTVEYQTTSYERMEEGKSCEVCGTVPWEGVLSSPRVTVGEPAPPSSSPYSVEINPDKLGTSLSILDFHQAQ